MYIYIYIYIESLELLIMFRYVETMIVGLAAPALTNRDLDFQGWNAHVRREFPGNIESTSLRRDNSY